MKTVIWLLFLPGFLCSENPLKINPDSLVTWRGSCVLIPCQISTYKGAALRDISLLWYFQPFYDTNQTEYFGDLLYNSSSTPRNYKTRSQTASASRFEFVGNLEKKNCSLKISQVQPKDSGIYGARLKASYSRTVQRNKWFLNATVNVAESPPAPKIDINPKDVQEGWTTVTCSAPYHCPEEPLRLIISGLKNSRFSSRSRTITNGVIQTVMRFQVTWKDHGKSLVCSLKRDREEISQNTMQLDVKYTPKDVQVRASPGTIVREGETLSLECMIKSSNPEVSEYLWYKDDQLMYEQPRLKKIEFETRGDRHSGAYRCEAKNSVGSQKSEELSIDVQYPPKETKVTRLPGGAVKEGERIDLQCSSKGNPPVTHYEWYKEPQTAVFQISEWLRFDAIQFGNSGTYYCVANNSLGHLKSSPIILDVFSCSKDVSVPPTSGPTPTAEREGPQSSPLLPSAPEGVSTPLPSTSRPPPLSELPPSKATNPPLPSSQTPCDGRTLWEEFSFLSESLDQVVMAQNQFSHSFQELTSAVVQLSAKLREALLQKRQKTCMVPSEIKKQ